jgi:methionyl-tRNA synthetase
VHPPVPRPGRYPGGDRPGPGADSPLAAEWGSALARFQDRFRRFLLDEAIAALWEFVGAANRYVDGEQPWVLAKAAKAGDEAAAARLRTALGDLVEACRLVGLASAPFIPGTAPRVAAQLGYGYPYGTDGNGGPPLLDELRCGAHAADAGTLGTPEPLFPRLEAEPVDAAS